MARNALLLLILAVLATVGCRRGPPPPPTWTYQGELHAAVAQCDRIVFRDDGFVTSRPIEEQGVLFEITNPTEIREVIDNLKFQTEQKTKSCFCVGYPGMDWYRGQERIAATSVQHGRAIRWQGHFVNDALLTEESGAWLRQWLMRHGLTEKAVDFRPVWR
jgi:hypothetical protein